MGKQRVGVGLIGFGGAGQVFHAPIIEAVEGLDLVKIRTTNQAHIEQCQQRYPQAQIVADSEEIFTDPQIEVVVVSTPNGSHFELTERALRAGKHVVVEKPFTITSAEADALIELAQQQERLLTVHHNRRWDSDFRTVSSIVEAGMLGRLVEVEMHYDRFRNWLKEGAWREKEGAGTGILYDLGSHLIDQAQCLFGLPTAVTADLRMQRTGAKTVDQFEVVLHYDDLKVTCKSGMLVSQPGPHFTVLGERGSFVKYGMDEQEEALKGGRSPVGDAQWGQEPESLWGQVYMEQHGLVVRGQVESMPGDYRLFYQNVYEAVLGKAELAVTAVQARNTIRLIELAMQSDAEKRTVMVSNE
ncbi:oxidoreductase [Marinicrinis sediminis]|uniref:Oxidoreductase n=1 Tax=Marinicrinis sediminis TaxID=1652465 RepID=A0ABW5R8D6_9BACL